MKKFWIKNYSSFGFNFFKYKKDTHKYNKPDMFVWRDDFNRLTGLKLKPGELVQCELKVIKREKG